VGKPPAGERERLKLVFTAQQLCSVPARPDFRTLLWAMTGEERAYFESGTGTISALALAK